MKLTNTLFIKWLFAAAMLLLMTIQLSAQDSCTFTLRIYDRYGDGWDDSQVYLKLGTNLERAYTHDGTAFNSADSIRLFQIRVRPGDSIVIRYVAMGTYQNEIKYALFNNAGDLVFGDGLTPKTGIVFRALVRCVNCGTAVNARVSAIRSTNATLTWSPTLRGTQPTYLVEWDTAGFLYGRGRNKFRTTDTFGIMTNLTETTNYSAYIQTLCIGNDSSSIVGPLNFRTDTATNVGIIAILNPVSSCNLGVDSIRIIMKNFAGSPQQLIPFKASVNGQLLNIPFPADGLFTGVLSKDSTTTLTFKTPFDFSTPGEYNIAAWTELTGDKNKKNDTFRIIVVRPRLVTQFPYVQNFENGKDTWSVLDTTPTKNSTWEFGTPRYRYIQGAASGTNCWTTAKDTAYNNNEFGYLLSPCFDFSQFTADPKINFAINVYSEKSTFTPFTPYDGAWLEGSTDGGKTWTNIGRRGTGINWYTDTINAISRSVWSGTTKQGWYLAQNTLTGMAGRSQCRLRFGFRTDGSGNTNFDGVAIDNIVIGNAPTVDLAADSVTYNYINYMTNCQIVMRIANLGTTPQSNFAVGYRVGNGTAVTENVTNLTIQPNTVATYRFNAKVPTSSTDQRLSVWVNATNDLVRANDSLPSSVLIPAAIKARTLYDFNSTTNPVPPYWNGIRASIGRSGHGNPTGNGYVFANIYTDTAIFTNPVDTIITPGAQGMQVTAGKFGPIRTDDTMRYDYRFVNESSPYAGYDLVTKDTLKVMVALDCDTVYTLVDTIFRSNHIIANTYRTRTIPLARFAGQIIKVRFEVSSKIDTFIGYYIDLDNLNILSCPQTFGHKSTITDATFGLANGKIVLSAPTAGAAPYTFLWSNGLSRDSIVNLAPGDYTVTMTDAKGCTEIRTLTVKRSTVSTNDPTSAINRLTLAPNPTTNSATLAVEFNRPVDTRVQVFNMMGQMLYQTAAKAAEQQTFDLDMTNRPAGVYLIRVTAENRSHVVRLVKQ